MRFKDDFIGTWGIKLGTGSCEAYNLNLVYKSNVLLYQILKLRCGRLF